MRFPLGFLVSFYHKTLPVNYWPVILVAPKCPRCKSMDGCMLVSCDGLAFHAECIPTLCPVFLGSVLEPTGMNE